MADYRSDDELLDALDDWSDELLDVIVASVLLDCGCGAEHQPDCDQRDVNACLDCRTLSLDHKPDCDYAV